MPPPTRAASQLNRKPSTSLLPKGIITRSRLSLAVVENQALKKRKADSPLKKTSKRAAFNDLTNAIGKSNTESKKALKNVTNTTKSSFSIIKDKKPLVKPQVPKVTLQRLPSVASRQKTKVPSTSLAAAKAKSSNVPQPASSAVNEPRKTRSSTRLSLESDKSENSLYVSALEDIGDEAPEIKGSAEAQKVKFLVPPRRLVPVGVNDFDAENENDPLQVSDYVMDIFEYLKDRESLYKIGDYMERQVSISQAMRSLLVDWMVEVQENFELNHETLYLAVKIVDLYLTKVLIGKEKLQLVGATAMFISSKFDERVPPLVDDLIYICDGAYNQDELIHMEVNILQVIDFDLSMPLSYRFLRRYARCAKLEMPQLTLARYILELSLMEYSMVGLSDSKLAAAALLLALRMQNLGGWTPTLEYYSGYSTDDIKCICLQLNEMLHKKPKSSLATIRNKYSHKVFFEVAKIPPLITLHF